jgi:ribosome-binding factor A
MARRKTSIEELIKQEVAKIVHKIAPKESMATVTDVKISNDMRTAQVWVSIYAKNEQKKIIRLLESKKFYIQDILNKKVTLKYVPKVTFKLDETGEKLDRIEKILSKDQNSNNKK